jgi:ADP-heptose:LPS heptosyltransferase
VSRILVIRLGAFGDFVLSFAPFAAIRAHHPGDQVTLLTTPTYVALAERAPWFDRVIADARRPWWHLAAPWRLRCALRGFDLVYDLQTSGRSSFYFHLAGRPRWSGIARGCSLPHANPRRDLMHTLERQLDQLAMAGVTEFPAPELGWLTSAAPMFALPEHFALLVPGAAPHRPQKRWPAERFGAVAAHLLAYGITPVVLGSRAESRLAATIRDFCPAAIDLTGYTALAEIGPLAARAALAIGNDTGPMHLAAAVGCRCLVVFSAASDPALTAPRGPAGAWPMVLRAPSLESLAAEAVLAALDSLLHPAAEPADYP